MKFVFDSGRTHNDSLYSSESERTTSVKIRVKRLSSTELSTSSWKTVAVTVTYECKQLNWLENTEAPQWPLLTHSVILRSIDDFALLPSAGTSTQITWEPGAPPSLAMPMTKCLTPSRWGKQFSSDVVSADVKLVTYCVY